MSSFWGYLVILPFLHFIVVTVYIAFDGFIRLPKHNELLNIKNDVFWGALIFELVMFVAPMLGAFGTGEMSALPWKAFVHSKTGDSIVAGVFYFCWTACADLWLLWIPAHRWIRNHSELQKQTRYMARVINVLAGLLLLTEHNPVLALFGVFD
jgi:hypothetical protein